MPRKINLTDKKFGRLLVLEETPQRKSGHVVWKCKCDCGKECLVSGKLLRNGDTQSCGCLANELTRNRGNDLVNEKFDRLRVIQDTNKSYRGHKIYLCKCDCGNEIEVVGNRLTTKNTTSCGCIKHSIGEANIFKILTQNNILFKTQFEFKDLPRRYFDFALFNLDGSLNRLIEFDGEQHYNENSDWYSEKGRERDIEKNLYCLENNIDLIRIPYSERDSMSIEILLNNKFIYKGDR